MTSLRSLASSLWEPAPARHAPTPFNSITRSYGLMRLVVGILGVLLPPVLFFAEPWLAGKWTKRGSLSAYYHTGVRDLFVGVLAVVGILLITYKMSELNRDNLFSFVAGFAAIVVALFPTGVKDDSKQTQLQEKFGEADIARVHFVFAFLFIISLGLLCREFARREKERTDHVARFSATTWFRFHRAAAYTIFGAVAGILVAKLFGWFGGYRLLVGETVVTLAFGLSWLAKGLDRDALPKLTKGGSDPTVQ